MGISFNQHKKSELKKPTLLETGVIFAICTTFALVCGALSFVPPSVSARDAVLPVEFNVDVDSVITVTLNPNEIAITGTPTPGGALTKREITANVSTNDNAGYTLTMHTLSSNNALVHNTATSNTIPSTTNTAESQNKDLTLNTWGYNLGAAAATTDFLRIPVHATPDTLRVTDGPGLNHQTTVTVGTLIDSTNLLAGTYSNTLIFTATTNEETIPDCYLGENAPIEGCTGTINNTHFGISSDGTNSATTTSGINNALTYAVNNGFDEVRLEDGNYLIEAVYSHATPTSPLNNTNCINVPSNLHFNLGGSTLTAKTNDSRGYSVVCFFDVDNAGVSNGTLVGDRDTHTYPSGTGTHEYGYGVHAAGSRNIVVDNLDISNFTGDGIMLSPAVASVAQESNSTPLNGISITNSIINNNRRQGISIIGALNVEIAYNEIKNTNGTDPQLGIDLEGEVNWPITGIDIHHNSIHSNAVGGIGVLQHSQEVDIHDNYRVDGIGVHGVLSWTYPTRDIKVTKIKVRNNNVDSRGIETVSVYYSSGAYVLENIIVEGNTITGGVLSAMAINNGIYGGNTGVNSYASMVGINGAFYNNSFTNSGTTIATGIELRAVTDLSNVWTAYTDNNSATGNYTTPINFASGAKMNIITDPAQLQTYLDNYTHW